MGILDGGMQIHMAILGKFRGKEIATTKGEETIRAGHFAETIVIVIIEKA